MSIFRPRAARRTIRSKILAIAWVPSLILLLVGVGVAGLFARQSLHQRDFTNSYVQAVQLASRFVVADQRERQLTVAYMLDRNRSRNDLDLQRLQTDAALARLTPFTNNLMQASSDTFVSAITKSGASVGSLPELRQGVDSGALTVREATNGYSQTLTVFHFAFENLATNAATARIASEYQLTANLFRLADWRSESETFEQAAYSATGLTNQEVDVYLDRVGGYHSLLAMTVPRLSAAEQADFKALMSSTAWQQLAAVESNTLRSGATERTDAATHRAGALPVNQANWNAASAEVSRMLINQYLKHVTYSTDLARDHANDLLVRSVAVGVGLLLLSLIVFAIVTRMSNRLIKRLRRLQSETMELVSQRLPAIVERLGQGAQVDLARDLPPLDHGSDEIGQVADAFNQAQRTAVAAAAKEAETRAGTSKVFLNIAHRSQIVAHRQLKLLDQAERTQEDPDQLSLLFQLDHLTTRARRNAENLIILGGGQPGRQWRNPVPLLDIVRSAVGEAETYTGITIGQMPKAAVAGAAVADLIHLLAELVDNATSFSPPTARVEVRGNVAGRGIVLEIEDQGLGIESEQLEQLNEMLKNPPDFSVMALSEEPRLGLFVVTQLAVRHGVRVTLTESPSYGGIRAVVLVPLALISSAGSTLAEMENGAGRGDQRKAIPGQVEVIGSVLPTRKSSRMISLAPGTQLPQPTAAEPTDRHVRGAGRLGASSAAERQVSDGSGSNGRTGSEAPSGSSASSLPRGFVEPLRTARRASGEGERQTAEIPAIKVDPPVSRETSGVPGSSDRSGGLGNSGEIGNPGAVGGRGAPEGLGNSPVAGGPATQDQRPALPRRTRQAHLAPQLLRDRRPDAEPAPAPPVTESLMSAESARDRLAAFQRGTRQGRQDEPNLGS